jgi:3-keto-disaccharide hydrolase
MIIGRPWAGVALTAAVLLLSSVAPPGQTAALAQAVSNAAETRKAIAVLQSDAGTFEKCQACQRLAAIGGQEAVPALSPLLADERLAAYARSALEAIGGESAGDALLAAIERLDGKLLIGAISSAGVLREARAARPLGEIARGADTEAAGAALGALGRIATPEATEVLLWALRDGPPDRRPAAAEACLACADRQLSLGRPREAARLYSRVRRADVPQHLRLAAACRLMVARQGAGVPILVEQLRSGDAGIVAMTLRAVREMPGREVTQALADELQGAEPWLQVMLIEALAERSGEGARAAIRAVTASDVREVRLAALKALGSVDVGLLRFVPLFDGRTFAGWEGDTAKSFRIEDGAVVGGSLQAPVPRNEFLCTVGTYANFILRVECKVVGANGGVQFRSQRVPSSAEVSGYQADMDTSGAYWGCLYDESRRGMLVQPERAAIDRIVKPNDWNAYEIRCEGPHIRLLLNGVQTVDYTETDPGVPASGVIGLQIHGGGPSEMWYRNITIAELP